MNKFLNSEIAQVEEDAEKASMMEKIKQLEIEIKGLYQQLSEYAVENAQLKIQITVIRLGDEASQKEA